MVVLLLCVAAAASRVTVVFAIFGQVVVVFAIILFSITYLFGGSQLLHSYLFYCCHIHLLLLTILRGL